MRILKGLWSMSSFKLNLWHKTRQDRKWIIHEVLNVFRNSKAQNTPSCFHQPLQGKVGQQPLAFNLFGTYNWVTITDAECLIGVTIIDASVFTLYWKEGQNICVGHCKTRLYLVKYTFELNEYLSAVNLHYESYILKLVMIILHLHMSTEFYSAHKPYVCSVYATGRKSWSMTPRLLHCLNKKKHVGFMNGTPGQSLLMFQQLERGGV